MTRKEVIDKIQKIEDKYPVHEWVADGIHVWPVIKIQVFFSWFYSIQKNTASTKKETNKLRLLPYLKSFWYWCKFWVAPLPARKYLFSGASSHRVVIKKQEFNRYFDPMMDFLDQQESQTCLIEQSALDANKFYYRRERIFNILNLFPLVSLRMKLFGTVKGLKGVNNKDQLLLCFEELANSIPSVTVNALKVKTHNQLLSISIWASVFDRVFDRVQPSYVFGLCYYSSMMYGMNLCAHRRGIVSVDMQHGTQGSLHVGYNNFSKVPINGYELLPKIFWCWEKGSANQIRRWVNTQSFHKVLVGGNPYIRQKEVLTQRKVKCILFTMQPLEPLVPDFIIDAIKQTAGEFLWCFRLHPRQQSQDMRRLQDLVKNAGIENNVTIEDSLQTSSTESILNSIVHVSRFSGSVIEAGLLGVPSIIIDEIGVDSFRTEIEDGIAFPFLGSEATEFIILIRELIGISKPEGNLASYEKILTDEF